jgi:hypothetical protein
MQSHSFSTAPRAYFIMRKTENNYRKLDIHQNDLAAFAPQKDKLVLNVDPNNQQALIIKHVLFALLYWRQIDDLEITYCPKIMPTSSPQDVVMNGTGRFPKPDCFLFTFFDKVERIVIANSFFWL